MYKNSVYICILLYIYIDVYCRFESTLHHFISPSISNPFHQNFPCRPSRPSLAPSTLHSTSVQFMEKLRQKFLRCLQNCAGKFKKKDWVKTSRRLVILATFPKFFLICFEVENQEFRHSHLDTGFKGKNAEVKDMQP